MAVKSEMQNRLDFWRDALKSLREAYLGLLNGGIKSYTLKDRTLTRLDLPDLAKEIEKAERKVDELEALADGGSPRKAFAVIPRDW